MNKNKESGPMTSQVKGKGKGRAFDIALR